MPADPILDLAVLLDLVLDFLQREQPALQSRKLALEHLQTVDGGAALPIQSLPRCLELGEQRFLAGKLGTALRQFLREARQPLRSGCAQISQLGEQSFLALLQPLQRLARMFEVRLFHLERLLGLRGALALPGNPSLTQAGLLLRLRQLELLLGEFAPGLLQSGSRLLEPRFPGPERLVLLHLVLPPGVALRAKLRKLRVEALAGIGNEADFGFKAGKSRGGPREVPLCGPRGGPPSVVALPRPPQIPLAFAQPPGRGPLVGRPS